jgi:hypothetical protein
MVGSACFALGAAPGYVSLVGAGADGVTFFVGSVFFTSAAFLQLVQASDGGPGTLVWWAGVIQFAGTLFFNVNTFDAMLDGLTARQENLLVWTPDALGSACFLIASELAFIDVGRAWVSWLPGSLDWWTAALNLLGSVFFGLSAVAGYVVPDTGDLLDAALVNAGTFLGAICFLVGAFLMLPAARTAPSS